MFRSGVPPHIGQSWALAPVAATSRSVIAPARARPGGAGYALFRIGRDIWRPPVTSPGSTTMLSKKTSADTASAKMPGVPS